MPCLAHLGPLTGRRWLVLVAGRRLLVCSLLVYSVLVARCLLPGTRGQSRSLDALMRSADLMMDTMFSIGFP